MTNQRAHLVIAALAMMTWQGTTQPSSAPPPSYTVQVAGSRAAEISPDDKWLTVLVVRAPRAAAPTVGVQVWDFRNATLVQSRYLEAPTNAKLGEPAYIGYTSDGNLLAVYAGAGVIHVLGVNDLKEVGRIQLDSVSARITGFEISPAGHIVALRRGFGDRGGDVRVYDLDSGKELRSWKIDRGVLDRGAGVAWRTDGRLLAVAAPDYIPCNWGGGTIHVFDPALDKPVSSFHVSFLPGSLAFGTGDKLYVASSSCGGFFANWTTDLPIFDAPTGRQIGQIPAEDVGIRNSIIISGDKKRLLAYADREQMTFEGFEDTLKISHAQWQVRDLATGKLVSTLPGAQYQRYSLTASGHFAVDCLHNEVCIFSLPTAVN